MGRNSKCLTCQDGEVAGGEPRSQRDGGGWSREAAGWTVIAWVCYPSAKC